MKRDYLLKCSKCDKDKQRRDVVIINHETICNVCKRERRKERRDKLKEGLRDEGIIKRRKSPQEMMEYKEEQKEQKLIKAKKGQEFIPIIKGSKTQSRKRYSTSLTFHEKQFLFGLLIKKGLSGDECKERLRNITEYSKKIREKIMSKEKDKSEVDRKFKEAFAELIEEETR